jgi:ferredoxin--NADP+ reductase
MHPPGLSDASDGAGDPAEGRILMTNKLGTQAMPARVAIVGSGPSGFYAAEALFGAEPEVLVDMYDRLPAPFGLVRYGVAPDHGKIKNVIKVYEKTASNPAFSFFGNVDVGVDIQVTELQKYYDAIILASGAQSDRRLGIPGEDLPGSHAATEFVAWYNGHPDYIDWKFDLSHEAAVVIGVGNSAVDVARILSKTVDELKNTDITEHALEVLAQSRVKDVHLVGRRGPAQAKFTPQELKELGEMESCDLVVDGASLELNPESQVELDDRKNSQARKIYKLLTDFAQNPPTSKPKRLFLRFLESPIELVGERGVEGIVLERNQLKGEPGNQKSTGTGSSERLDCGVVFRSVGYRGTPIPGVPFYEKWAVIPNEAGRVVDEGKPIPGLYTSGWIKRGPTGIIGTNKPCSMETVKSLLADLPGLEPCPNRDSRALREHLTRSGVRIVDYGTWKKIDAAEVDRGAVEGKPREKFITVDDMLAAAGKGKD